jgi:hypothetical protein
MNLKTSFARVLGCAFLGLAIGASCWFWRADAAPLTQQEPGARVLSAQPEVITVETVAGEAERGTVLKIQNQTPFLVIIYSSGVRIGWLRPHRLGLIRGLNSGYHRLFAHTQYASNSWGPRDVWVPGSWNLSF